MKRVLNYLQSTEEQAVWICLMLWSKVVIVEEPHFEDGVVNTDTHVRNGYTTYHLQQREKLVFFKCGKNSWKGCDGLIHI